MSVPVLPPFRSAFAPPDEDLAAGLLAHAARDAAAERRVDDRARALVEAIRAKGPGGGSAASRIFSTLIHCRPKRGSR